MAGSSSSSPSTKVAPFLRKWFKSFLCMALWHMILRFLCGMLQIGEFQCYDRRALASLAAAAEQAGHAEWGYGGPHDAGNYLSQPEVGTCLLRACLAPITSSQISLQTPDWPNSAAPAHLTIGLLPVQVVCTCRQACLLQRGL